MHALNQISQQWAQYAFVHALETSAFILLILLADQLIRLKTQVRYGLWFLALLKLFVPPIFSIPETFAAQTQIPVITLPAIDFIAAKPAVESLSLASLLLLGWLASSALLAAILITKHRLLKSHLHNATPLSLTELNLRAKDVPAILRFYLSASKASWLFQPVCFSRKRGGVFSSDSVTFLRLPNTVYPRFAAGICCRFW